MKNLWYSMILAAGIFSACSTPFVPNTDNALLEGEWEITKVSSEGAAVSVTEIATTVLAERFKEGDYFVFEKGANFQLKDNDGKEKLNGQYGISVDNKTLSLQLSNESSILNYDIIGNEDKISGFNSSSAGETTNLSVHKK